eukprot:5639778-Pleurochrysis_carterae.AAC.1
MSFSQSQESLRKRGEGKAVALECIGVFQQAKVKAVNRQVFSLASKLNTVKHQVKCHSKQAPVACKESTLKLRGKCASLYAKRVEYLGQRPCKSQKQHPRGYKAERQKGRKPR